ncbi:TonB-dependent receptor [Xanthomonas sp. 3075]|uniref:TonB-dependent receptor n=1 Tax=Xanthomonas sp. 3075 TaxID=3035315 RepID=UPI001613E531|nr:TonB-dependent receptor [Xanthomonas sp. 3075]MBB4131964.1 TonB-dependent receptor [Xanthomonas sp. 3075]
MSNKTPLCLAITLTLAAATWGPLAHAADGAAEATDATTLDAVKVLPQLMAQERAIDLKRSSDAILDAVSSDAMGNYPDKNVAESLQRLPGVSVTRDQGEGRFVVVRGLDAALNSVSVDGIAIGTPESDNRAAPMDVIPSESTERLKVVKSPTPDMPGDSIGGAILVESASAFDRQGRAIRAKVEANHQQLSGKTSPKASFNYSDLFADQTFGVALGVNYQDREFQSDNTEGEYDAIDNGDMVMVEQQRRKYYVDRKRAGANLNLDWHPDQDNRYYLRSLFSSFKDAETRQNTVLAFDPDDIQANGDGTYAAPYDTLSKRVRNRTKDQDTLATSFGAEHRLVGAVVDYQLGYTKTRERVKDEMEARFDYDGDLDGSIDQNSRLPVFGMADASWIDNGNYAFDKFVLSPGQTDDAERSARINARFDADNASYKVGLLGRWREREVDGNEIELSEGPAVDPTSWTVAPPAHRRNSLGQALSSSAMRAYWNKNRNLYSADDGDVGSNAVAQLAEDYTSKEDILAAYAMGTWDLTPSLRVIAGVRVESTRFTATGNQVDVADDGESFTVTGRRADSSYTNVLPGLHLRWDGGDSWALRGSVNKTVSRPGFGQIAPSATINTGDNEVTLGNPQLDPYESTNLDLAFEKYIGQNGIVSLGLFGKSIDGYIVNTTVNNNAEFAGYDVTTAINGDKAKVYGAEFNWQQQFDFLPGVWSGLLAGVSGTWLHTDFDPGLEDRAGEDFTLPRASRNVYSAFLGYEKHGISTRVSAVHRSEYLDELGQSRAYDIFVAPNTQLDLSLSYQLTSDVQLYFEASNLLDEPLERYQGTRSHTQQMEEYGRAYGIGLRVNL